MFFYLSKILLFLIEPLNWLVILSAYSLFAKNPKRKRRALRVLVALTFICTNPLIGNFVAGMYESEGVKVADLSTEYEYAVVLGGFSNLETPWDEDRMVLGWSPNRITQAFELYRIGKVKKILLTGGNGNIVGNQENEALLTFDYLRRLGMPEADIVIESEARNTYENFYYTQKLLPENAKVLVITSAFHVPRSRAIAKKSDFNCSFYPTDWFHEEWVFTPSQTFIPDVKFLRMWQVYLKEWFGIVAYRLRGYL